MDDLGIARTTPVLFGMFSLVTLLAEHLRQEQTQCVRTAAWYTQMHFGSIMLHWQYNAKPTPVMSMMLHGPL